MLLAELIDGLTTLEVRGMGEVEIADLAYDSRAVQPGSAFVCVPGLTADGHDFARHAVEAGAVALVAERRLDLGVPEVIVADARAAMAPLAARLFGDPTAELEIVAITGTNGKTTTTFMVRTILEATGRRCGLLGTVRRVVGGVVERVERTTPEAIDLQRTFRRMLDAGDVACALEASSHALSLHRVDAIHHDAAAFTNLTQDHLDFHADMEDYFAAKRSLFIPVEDGAGRRPRSSAVNIDDPFGARLAAELEAEGEPPITFSASGREATLMAREVAFDAAGARFRLVDGGGEREVRLPVPGHFNVENALAALAVCAAIGVDLDQAAAALSRVEPVPGRMEPVDEGQPFAVLVDYAHTPEALENVLRAARRLTGGRLITAFGCGGDRDRGKRPLMGRVASELSDAVVVTSDNPRSEPPGRIIDEILAGLDGQAREGVAVIEDRRAAIAAALERAASGDLVLIAGKGHEQGQEFEGGRKLPFDDRDVAREELRRLGAAAAGGSGSR